MNFECKRKSIRSSDDIHRKKYFIKTTKKIVSKTKTYFFFLEKKKNSKIIRISELTSKWQPYHDKHMCVVINIANSLYMTI